MPSACSEATGAMPAAWAGGAVCPDTSEYSCIHLYVGEYQCAWIPVSTVVYMYILVNVSVSGYQ